MLYFGDICRRIGDIVDRCKFVDQTGPSVPHPQMTRFDRLIAFQPAIKVHTPYL
ncbi:hypothetical protein CJA_2922 [Cellvibrio japonicus Ueda107]|uniref:Uncharacterized protein n=1 Tax=Cellvibrio japonicus (strain Ueda107) TaxID=498211 RepID=B3PCL3_CELJU|nr:hypothetical protein CJA_2922 [Cellvibrio japonicus Ueda107]